jgi:hypothetical protein
LQQQQQQQQQQLTVACVSQGHGGEQVSPTWWNAKLGKETAGRSVTSVL